MKKVPTLIGIDGPFKGEIHVLEHFRPYVIGRSREADISVKRTQIYKLQSDDEREKDRATKTISARHCRIVYYNINSIEIKNLSSNGTRVDGTALNGSLVISDLNSTPHEILIGENAKFRLEMRELANHAGESLPL